MKNEEKFVKKIKSKNYDIIYTQTSDNVQLKGYYIKNKSATCVLYMHGLAGDFDSIAKTCGYIADKLHFSFLSAMSRDAKIKNELTQKIGNVEKKIKAGTKYFNFKDTYIDYSAWFQFLEEQGYKNIYLIGHSLACDKIIAYLNEFPTKKVKKILFLSSPKPLNSIIEDDQYQKAKEQVELGNGDELGIEKFLDFCELSNNAVCNLKETEFEKYLPFQMANPNYVMLKNIKVEKLFVIGSCDQDLKIKKINYVKKEYEKIKKQDNNSNYKIIENAKHTYKNYYLKLAKVVLDFFYNNKRKNIIISGPPRTGKSTLGDLFCKKLKFSLIENDGIICALEKAYPEVGVGHKIKYTISNERYAPFAEEFLDKTYLDLKYNNNASVIVGAQFEPKYLAYFNCLENYIAVFLGVTDLTQQELFNEIKNHDTASDWTHKLDDERLLRQCKDIIKWSEYIKQQCEEYNMVYIDMGKNRNKKIKYILKNYKNLYKKPKIN